MAVKMMMHYPELYKNFARLPKRDTKNILEKYARKIKWNRINDKIIDLGCGDGSTTANILKQYLPQNFLKLVGCDVSEEMVNYANQHHSDERTSFIKMDIERHLPAELKNSFDHAFSFFALHWIRDHRVAFSNIYNILRDQGDCMLLFVGYTPIHSVFRALSSHNKWSPWLGDIESFVSIYHDVQNPEERVKDIMEKAGFKNINVNYNETSYVYDNTDTFLKSMKAINPFEIPPGLENEFSKNLLDVALDTKGFTSVCNEIKMEHKLLECYGSK